ncbi:Plant methyltransferase dimerization [Penicillium waksmanii]|uniref:Plant methyltransferase dimerization n=1 Tax=Penicillium waksmanii TaxID=69791 RepID=UPI0025473F18|nr:Plant methyltransferase dimerization [Penicillium waksmanii]KAJ5975404.1 Plant methyltransferase dimerization [Penicillium waksmanii]
MNFPQIRSLVADIAASVDLYESTGSEEFLVDTQEDTTRLARALENPRDAIVKHIFAPSVLVIAKIAHEMEIFTLLSRGTVPVPLAELAALKPADPLLVERIMRLLVANGFADEPVQCEYLPTAISKEMAQRGSVAMVETLAINFLTYIQKLPEYLKAINYRNLDDSLFAPFQYCHHVTVDAFTWISQNPDTLKRFNSFMEGYRGNRPHWSDWFPIRERILDSQVLDKDKPLLVDIGAGRGYGLMKFRSRFPDVPGRLILQDLPLVIDEIRGACDLKAAGVETIAFNLFADVQPVKDARIYYMKSVLHDWPDTKAALILNNIKQAMKPGYSKLILEEFILPDTNTPSLACMTDLAVMIFSSGLERNRKRWTDLMTLTGLRILQFWVPRGDGMGIIEAEVSEFEQ